MENMKDGSKKLELGEAIERILVESELSLSAFSRKVGYSRQYVYDLLKTKDPAAARKIQLDTLKKICDATGYSLRRLLTDIGYLPECAPDVAPNSVIVVKKNGVKEIYCLKEGKLLLLKEVVQTLAKATLD